MDARAKVVVVRPGEAPTVEEVAGFQGVKELLGGAHLERIRFGPYDVLCDEDGLRKKLPQSGRLGLVGTFVVTHLTDPDLTSLTDDEVLQVCGLPPAERPMLRMKPDTRSERWKAAESRCGPHKADPEDLAIIAEEQAKWDAEHPDESGKE
jgi:hypothetical protein